MTDFYNSYSNNIQKTRALTLGFFSIVFFILPMLMPLGIFNPQFNFDLKDNIKVINFLSGISLLFSILALIIFIVLTRKSLLEKLINIPIEQILPAMNEIQREERNQISRLSEREQTNIKCQTKFYKAMVFTLSLNLQSIVISVLAFQFASLVSLSLLAILLSIFVHAFVSYRTFFLIPMDGL